MHSRLYTRVLNQHPWVHNCTALNSIYNTTGLVGVFASAESGRAADMVDVLCKEMQARGRRWVALGLGGGARRWARLPGAAGMKAAGAACARPMAAQPAL